MSKGNSQIIKPLVNVEVLPISSPESLDLGESSIVLPPASIGYSELVLTRNPYGFWPLDELTKLLPTQDYDTLILSQSPRAYYKFDETAGSTWIDSSGNGYNGTHINSPTLGAEGILSNSSGNIYGKAAIYNSSLNQSSQENSGVIADNNDFYIEYWIVYLGGDMRIMRGRDGFGSGQNCISLPSNSGLNFSIVDSNGTQHGGTTSYKFGFGKIYMISHRVLQSAGTYESFVNGVSIDGAPISYSGTALLRSSTVGWNTGRQNSSSTYFNQIISRFSIFTNTNIPSDAQILEHYQAGADRTEVADLGTGGNTGQYHFNYELDQPSIVNEGTSVNFGSTAQGVKSGCAIGRCNDNAFSFPLTIEAWCNVPNLLSPDVIRPILSTHNNLISYKGVTALLLSNGQVRVVLGDGVGTSFNAGSERRVYTPAGAVQNATKTHIVIVLRSAIDADIYVNNVAQSLTYDGTGSLSIDFSSSNPSLTIGSANGSSAPGQENFFEGGFDNIVLYETELTTDDVNANYLAGTA
jgi:hypothetical protein